MNQNLRHRRHLYNGLIMIDQKNRVPTTACNPCYIVAMGATLFFCLMIYIG